MSSTTDVVGSGAGVRRRTLVSAGVGNTVEWYDFAVHAAFGTVLVPIFPVRTPALGLTAGLSTALVGGTAPFVDQLLFLATGSDTTPALYVTAVGCLAVLAVSGRPETPFSALD